MLCLQLNVSADSKHAHFSHTHILINILLNVLRVKKVKYSTQPSN